MNILVPCSLLAENIFRFFEVRTYPSIHHFGLDVPPCNAISEGRLPLCSTSSEAGALPSEVHIENDSDRKFSKSIFFSKIFWKPLLSTFYGTLFIISRKYFFGFSKSALRTYRTPHPSIHHFGLEASPL